MFGPGRHWCIRGRLPPSAGESVTNLQALLSDMTPVLAQQLRSVGGFDIFQFCPRMDGGNHRDVMMVHRFDLLRQALGAIRSFGLEDTDASGALCLARTHKLDACFVDTSMCLRANVPKAYDFLGSNETTKRLGDMINDELRPWIGELARSVQAEYSAATPP